MKNSINTYLKLLDLPLGQLIARADAVRRKQGPRALDLCTIVNAKSGICGEDCKFCAQAACHKTGVATYPLKDKAALIEAAQNAAAAGSCHFGIVTAGNRLNERELGLVIEAVSEIKRSLPIQVCASLGALAPEALRCLKAAGLSRYHHNIETSPRFYKKIVTTHSFAERLATIRAAQAAGLKVCSGGIIGMGETWRDRLAMAMVLKQLDVDSVPINVLVPIAGTPLAGLSPIACADVLKTIALFRIILPDKTIKVAAGRETVLKDFQGAAFLAGANGMLVGGYLTVTGREVAADRLLAAEIERLWRQ